MAVAKLDLRDVVVDPDGVLNAGGFIQFYAANTMTPLATFSDPEGETENDNPIELDASGQGHVYLTVGRAYDIVFKDADSVTFYTAEGVIIRDNAAYDVAFYFSGTPTVSQEMFRFVFPRDVVFPANWEDAAGSNRVDPAIDFVAIIQRDDEDVGTLTAYDDGHYSFLTVDQTSKTFDAGTALTVIAPEVADEAIAGIAITFAGRVV